MEVETQKQEEDKTLNQGDSVMDAKTYPWWVMLVVMFASVGLAFAGAWGIWKLYVYFQSTRGVESQVVDVPKTQEVTPTIDPGKALVSHERTYLSLQTYVDDKDGFSIIPPKGWSYDDTGKLGAPIYFFGPEATDEGRIYKTNIMVQVGENKGNTLDSYANQYLEGVGKELTSFKIIDKSKMFVNANEAMVLHTVFGYKGLIIRSLMIIMINGEKSYVVSGYALDKVFDIVEPMLSQSILTFMPN